MEQTHYRVKIELTEMMLGTMPDPAIFRVHVEPKAPKTADTEEEIATIPELEEKGTTRFHADPEGKLGLFIYSYMVIGFLKEAGNSLKDALNIKAIKSKVEQFVFCTPRKIYLFKEKPDGILERPKRVNGPMGPQSTLGRSEFVNAGTQLNFDLTIVKNKEITDDVVREILSYGELKGLGQWRNGGYGSFKVLLFKQVV